jgi:hypothetical protein
MSMLNGHANAWIIRISGFVEQLDILQAVFSSYLHDKDISGVGPETRLIEGADRRGDIIGSD